MYEAALELIRQVYLCKCYRWREVSTQDNFKDEPIEIVFSVCFCTVWDTPDVEPNTL